MYSVGMEQSATRDSALLLTCDISERDQVSPFPSVVLGAVYSLQTISNRLRLRWAVLYQRVKCPRNYCDGSTIIWTFLVVVVVVALVVVVANLKPQPMNSLKFNNCIIALCVQLQDPLKWPLGINVFLQFISIQWHFKSQHNSALSQSTSLQSMLQ